MKYLFVILFLVLNISESGLADTPRFDSVSLHQGQENSENLHQQQEDRVVVNATGRESYFGSDDGTFVFKKTTDLAWRFTAKIAKVEGPEGLHSKYGLSVRTGTERWNRGLLIRYDMYEKNRCIQWLHRYNIAYTTHDGSRRTMKTGLEKEMNLEAGFWLRLEYHYPTLRAFYSIDGEQWEEIASQRRINVLENPLYIGPMVTAGGDGKTNVRVWYEGVTYEKLEAQADSLSPAQFTEFKPLMPYWDLFVVHDKDEKLRKGGGSWMIMKPRDLEWKDVNALFLTTSSKEIIQQKDSGELTMLDYEKNGPLRIPQGIPQKGEHVYEIRPKPLYRIFAENKWVHFASAVKPVDKEHGLRKLSEAIGYPVHHIPVIAEGGSFAGENTTKYAAFHPEKTIAASAGIIGIRGWPAQNPATLTIPHFYGIGTHDGKHLEEAEAKDQPIRQRGALWAMMPMKWLYHDWGNIFSVSFPWFQDVVELRLPKERDTSVGPVDLKELSEEEGWIALYDTVPTNFPQVVAWADATEEQRRGHNWWLPSERSARLWQAGTSDWPETVIHFPRFDHTVGWGASLNKSENRYHQLKADTPFHLMASGPVAAGVEVTYYADLKPLKVLKTYNNDPYLVQLEGLPEGLHNLYAITKFNGQEEISKPQMIFFNQAE